MKACANCLELIKILGLQTDLIKKLDAENRSLEDENLRLRIAQAEPSVPKTCVHELVPNGDTVFLLQGKTTAYCRKCGFEVKFPGEVKP